MTQRDYEEQFGMILVLPSRGTIIIISGFLGDDATVLSGHFPFSVSQITYTAFRRPALFPSSDKKYGLERIASQLDPKDTDPASETIYTQSLPQRETNVHGH